MKYTGNAPLYSAFVLLAIESVYPTPSDEGDELSPDQLDLSLYSDSLDDTTPQKSKLQTSYAQGGASDRKSGYYRILPLNVIRASSDTKKSGTDFSVTFTLDELVLIANKEDVMDGSSAIPFSRSDLAAMSEGGDSGSLPTFLPGMHGGWEYQKDEELGFARYRVSGDYAGFTVDDLVSTNDTVSLWFFHDPKDFYSKDGDAIVAGELVETNQEITNIIGSGNRKHQSNVSNPSLVESMLGAVGIVNEFNAAAMKRATLFEDNSPATQIPQVTQDNVWSVLVSYVEGAAGKFETYNFTEVEDYTTAVLGVPTAYSQRLNHYLFRPFLTAYHPVDTAPAGAEIEERDTSQRASVSQRQALRQTIATLTNQDGVLVATDDTDFVGTNLEYSGEPNHREEFVSTLNEFISLMNTAIVGYSEDYEERLDNSNLRVSRQTFANGRQMLLTNSHGETPYMVLKGQIASVSTVVGTENGTNTVTISGTGYEKILNDSEVYYESYLTPEKPIANPTEHLTVYAKLTAPRAILHLLSDWAAKQVIFGKKTNYSSRMSALLTVLPGTDEEVPEDGKAEDQLEVEQKLEGYWQDSDKIPVRGTLVMAEYHLAAEASPEKIRLFTPLNYLDTTRLHETVRINTLAYQNPEAEGILGVPTPLTAGASIMQNAQQLSNSGEFYELFVNESGKVIYRMRMEAIERTPDPAYTPTIQDVDVLASGTEFMKDSSEITTLVTVHPDLGTRALSHGAMWQVGRATPEGNDPPPIVNFMENLDHQSLSEPLFRYGLRTKTINDQYIYEQEGTARKARLYLDHYGEPLNKAQVKVLGNPAYKLGETVLTVLQTVNRRSKTLVDVDEMIDWLEWLGSKGKEEYMEMYIGVDRRLLNKDYFVGTSGEYTPIPDAGEYNSYSQNPHKYVLTEFLDTFKQMKDWGATKFTPEYFPNVWWYYRKGLGDNMSYDQSRIVDADTGRTAEIDGELVAEKGVITDFYDAYMRYAFTRTQSSIDTMRNLIKNNNSVLNYAKFQNFLAMSHHIDGVSHQFQQDSTAVTSLSLNYGQDNLVLLEPRSFLPIGHISIGRKMRFGYDSEQQKKYWINFDRDGLSDESISPLQHLHLMQFSEDKRFKEGSFQHSASEFRNTSNYMYQIAMSQGLDTGVHASTGSTETRVTMFDTGFEVPFVTENAVTQAYREAAERGGEPEDYVEDFKDASTIILVPQDNLAKPNLSGTLLRVPSDWGDVDGEPKVVEHPSGSTITWSFGGGENTVKYTRVIYPVSDQERLREVLQVNDDVAEELADRAWR